MDITFHNVTRVTNGQERCNSDERINEGLFALFVWKHLDYMHVLIPPIVSLGEQYIYMFIDIGTHVIKSHGTYIVLLYGDSSRVLY